ncbi:hypothetical protein MSPP1_001870 [Malassezia sp. CBS 17886]|nr:hypothetical protein MSPP1_001870 [Malassezia sp. CBS 17886]
MRPPLRDAPSASAAARGQTAAPAPALRPPGGDVLPSEMLAHLNSLGFSPSNSQTQTPSALLGTNEVLAATALTHESWMYGMHGHNRRLAFLGRRVLKTYLTLFLYNALAAAGADAEYLAKFLASPKGVDEVLTTQHLGDHVGRALRLEKVMRWLPATNLDTTQRERGTGLFKVRGTCVEAVVGAIYHHRGAQIAQQFFLSRVLPHLELITQESPPAMRERIAQASKEATEALSYSP